MKYKAYITYMVYDSIEIEIDRFDSFRKVIDAADAYIEASPHQYDEVEVEYEEIIEEED